MGDLISKDTDGDGIPDWEEGLWGTDPASKETTPGIPDSTAIAKLKQDGGNSTGEEVETEENLTETDKFSRELFATTAALNQGGNVSQEMAEQIGNSLADKITNTPVRKVYTAADIKVINDNSAEAVKKYVNAVDTLDINLRKKYPAKYNSNEVLEKFVIDENNVDVNILKELSPGIKQSTEGIQEMLKVQVPSDLAQVHLDLINATERVMENLIDFQLFETDPIVAMAGISQYQKNTELYLSIFETYLNTIIEKLKS